MVKKINDAEFKEYYKKDNALNLLSKLKDKKIDYAEKLVEEIVSDEGKRLETSEKKATYLVTGLGILSGLLLAFTKYIFENPNKSIIFLFLIIAFLISLVFLILSFYKSIKVLERDTYFRYTTHDLIRNIKSKTNLKKEYVATLLAGSLNNYKVTNKKVTYFAESIHFFKIALLFILITIVILIILNMESTWKEILCWIVDGLKNSV